MTAATASCPGTSIVLDGVDAIADGRISFHRISGEAAQKRVFPAIAASTLVRVLRKAQISSFRNQPVKNCLLAGDSFFQTVNLGLLLILVRTA